MKFDKYEPGKFYDEYFEPGPVARAQTELLVRSLHDLSDTELAQRQASAEASLLHLGITFNVYGDEMGMEKIMPFDILPRIVSATEWEPLELGLKQRIQALNLFLDDIYHDQNILQDDPILKEVILSAKSFRKQCEQLDPPSNVWCHVTGTDLVRDGEGVIHVLEDNLRCPSGVSYVLENREVMKRTFPQIFEGLNIRAVNDYPSRLLEVLLSLSNKASEDTQVVVLTPGPANSAYFEHSYLAMQMGVQLVEGGDLEVKDGFVHMRTTQGLKPVDVIYRRIDDDFLDPLAFRPDSLLGVPGLMDAYRAKHVAIANAPGCGVADDKVVYTFVPKMIRYYLDEDPILPNVPTFLCWIDEQRDHVLNNLETLVVKAANEAGGYGMLIGPASTKAMQDEFAAKIRHDPRNYIAQPTLALSRVPVLVDGATCEGRHVDLRPYILCKGDDIFVLPGGLTRVALTKGSLVVNSSQGGGSKDTWVLGS